MNGWRLHDISVGIDGSVIGVNSNGDFWADLVQTRRSKIKQFAAGKGKGSCVSILNKNTIVACLRDNSIVRWNKEKNKWDTVIPNMKGAPFSTQISIGRDGTVGIATYPIIYIIPANELQKPNPKSYKLKPINRGFKQVCVANKNIIYAVSKDNILYKATNLTTSPEKWESTIQWIKVKDNVHWAAVDADEEIWFAKEDEPVGTGGYALYKFTVKQANINTNTIIPQNALRYGDIVFLKSSNGSGYLLTLEGGRREFRTVLSGPNKRFQDYEKYIIINPNNINDHDVIKSNGKIALKSVKFGKYIGAIDYAKRIHHGYGKVYGTGNTISPINKWTIKKRDGSSGAISYSDKVYIKSVAAGKYLRAGSLNEKYKDTKNKVWEHPIVNLQNKVGSWEKWTIEPANNRQQPPAAAPAPQRPQTNTDTIIPQNAIRFGDTIILKSQDQQKYLLMRRPKRTNYYAPPPHPGIMASDSFDNNSKEYKFVIVNPHNKKDRGAVKPGNKVAIYSLIDSKITYPGDIVRYYISSTITGRWSRDQKEIQDLRQVWIINKTSTTDNNFVYDNDKIILKSAANGKKLRIQSNNSCIMSDQPSIFTIKRLK